MIERIMALISFIAGVAMIVATFFIKDTSAWGFVVGGILMLYGNGIYSSDKD